MDVKIIIGKKTAYETIILHDFNSVSYTTLLDDVTLTVDNFQELQLGQFQYSFVGNEKIVVKGSDLIAVQLLPTSD